MNPPCPFKVFKKHRWSLYSWAGAILLLFGFHTARAQNNITFEAATDVKEAIVGVPFELSFTLKNADGARFSPPKINGFRSSGISEMRGASIVNGRSSTTQTWSMELIAGKPGVYTIGPATVIAGGKTLSTASLTLKVSAPSGSKGNVSLPPGTDDRVFVAGEFDVQEAYLGQQITWRIRLFTQLSVEGYDIIGLPDFEGFYSKEKIRFDKRVEYLNIRGKKYAARTLHEFALFPQETGNLVVSAARISVGIEQPGAQGFLFGPKPVNLQTQANEITVKPLPQPAPADFTGGVGSYEWEVKGDSSRLTTDDAFTLVVEIKGNGDARRFAAPKIAVPPGCETFEPRILEEEEYESETGIMHRKKYEFVVLPKDTGFQEINPIISYFNPDSNRYCQLRTASIGLSVSAGKNYQSPSISPLPAPTPPPPPAPGFFELAWEWLSSPLFWSIIALPFLGLGIFIFLKKRKSNAPPSISIPAPSPSPVQPPISGSAARQRFLAVAHLLNQEDPHPFYEELFKSMQAWLLLRLHLQPAQMNDAEVSKALLNRGVPPIRIQALLSVWHTCEQAIYGGQAQTEQVEPTWQLARQVMEALETELK